MRFIICYLFLPLAGFSTAFADAPSVIFEDSFRSPDLAPDWKVESGSWKIEDGSLKAAEGGIIVLDKSMGTRFDLELELNYRGNVIVYLDEEKSSLFRLYSYHHANRSGDQGTLYVWEGDPNGKELLFYNTITADVDLGPGVFQKVRLSYDSGSVRIYFNDNLKESVTFRINPDPRLSIDVRNIQPGDYLQIRNLKITKSNEPPKVLGKLKESDLLGARIHTAGEYEVKPVADARLTVSDGGAVLDYGFQPGDAFESRFARLPVEVPRGGRVWMELEGDGSGNLVFVTLQGHDGERHVVAEIPLRWEGRRDIGINLAPFLVLKKERTRKSWGGNENQVIDFPIKALDIGVAKREARVGHAGKLKFGNVRFAE